MYSHQNIIPPGPGCLVHVRASSDAVISLPTHTIDISASLMHSNKPVRLYTAHEIDIRSLSDLLPLFFYLLPILMPYPRARVGEFFITAVYCPFPAVSASPNTLEAVAIDIHPCCSTPPAFFGTSHPASVVHQFSICS